MSRQWGPPHISLHPEGLATISSQCSSRVYVSVLNQQGQMLNQNSIDNIEDPHGFADAQVVMNNSGHIIISAIGFWGNEIRNVVWDNFWLPQLDSMSPVIPTSDLFRTRSSFIVSGATPVLASGSNVVGNSVLGIIRKLPELSSEGVIKSHPSYGSLNEGLNFGAINVGTQKTLNLAVQNRGTEPLLISSVSVSDPFSASMSVQVPALSIANINIVFSPTTAGDFNGTLTFSTNDSDNPSVQVTLFGHGSP